MRPSHYGRRFRTRPNTGSPFLEPSNSTHRQYEALRAYFVEKPSSSAQQLPASATLQAAFAFSSINSSGNPTTNTSVRLARGKAPRQTTAAIQVVTLRKQTLSVHDSALPPRDGESLSPAAVAAILKEEGFAKLPRRRDEERPGQPRPITADVADFGQLNVAPRTVHTNSADCFCFCPTWSRPTWTGCWRAVASPDRP